jgi:hypothetical protein
MSVKSRLQKIWGWFIRHHAGITALATVALMIITFFYLQETKGQRELMYRQLVLSNSPSLLLNPPFPFEYTDPLKTGISINNTGGEAEDIDISLVFICCSTIEGLKNKPKDIKTFLWKWHIPRLGHQQLFSSFSGFVGENRNLIESASQNPEPMVYAFSKLTYKKPALKYGDKPVTVNESRSFWWNSKFKTWMISQQYIHDLIEPIIETRNALQESQQR